jgi:hypothetical protein
MVTAPSGSSARAPHCSGSQALTSSYTCAAGSGGRQRGAT